MTALKPKKPSLVDFTNKYSNNDEACFDFFWKIKFPEGFVCEKCGCTHYCKLIRHNVTECSVCGHQHYLFAGTIFQDNKLPLYKLLLGLFLFFVNNKGISVIEMRSHLNVNYKTALLLARKCRILMQDSNNSHKLFELDEHYPRTSIYEVQDTSDPDSPETHMALSFRNHLLDGFLKEWQLRKQQLSAGEISKEEYQEWKYGWPQTADDCGKHTPARQWRKSK